LRVRFSSQAEVDLERIGDIIAIDNARRAVSFVRELRAKCESIGRMPLAHPVVVQRPGLGMRRRVHGNYLIFYRLTDTAAIIVRILHGAMDHERLLFPDDER
jgi:toxin ParE1/3/4